MNNETIPQTAALLRKLEAAVSGWQEQEMEEFYFVVSHDGRDYSFEPQDAALVDSIVHFGRQDADNVAATARQRGVTAAQVFGPFRSTRARGDAVDVRVARVCSKREGDPEFIERDVPEGVDMMCWTPAAFEKFVAPYYYHHWGSNLAAAKKVQALKRELMNQSRSGILIHTWPTFPGSLVSHEELGDGWAFLPDGTIRPK